MKSIILKISKEEIQGKKTIFTTYDILKICANKAVEGGFSVDEMKARIRLLNELDKHQGLFKKEFPENDEAALQVTAELELEDADYAKLKELAKSTKWGIVSKTIIELIDSFE